MNVWSNGKTARHNLADYMSDMDVIVSHLEAARSVAVGLYQHNPDSRKIPSFDGLYDDLQAMCLELRDAKKVAENNLNNLLTHASSTRPMQAKRGRNGDNAL